MVGGLGLAEPEDEVRRPRWWLEVLLIGAFYGAYSVVRNQFGSGQVSPATALNNAVSIIDIERAMGLYVEPAVQRAFIDQVGFIQFWNLFYGLFHFLVTFGVLLWLYVRRPRHYRFWRTAGLACTGLALIGFAVFPLMPPRLLAVCESAYGGCATTADEAFDDGDLDYVDTVIEMGGLWSFESDGMEEFSNQYAAMPSLHVGWALWSALALLATVRSRLGRLLAAAYPVLTMFAIVVTANHYWIDGVGGAAVVLVGLGIAKVWGAKVAGARVGPRQSATIVDG